MSADAEDIRFGEILSRLLSTSRYRTARGALAADIGVSPSAVSQYLSGSALPRIDVLARLARALNVSTDYLIFGTERHLPLSREQAFLRLSVDDFLSNYRSGIERQSWLKLELAERIDRRMDDIVREEFFATLDAAGVGPGLLQDAEVRQIEAISAATTVVSMTLKYNVVGDEESGFKAGPFADTVVENIVRGSAYTYVIPSDPNLRLAAKAMIGIFSSLAGRDISSDIRVFVTEISQVGGFLIYDVDGDVLAMRNPYLSKKVEEYLRGSQLGLMAGTSDAILGDMIMDERHLSRAQAFIAEVMNEAEQLS